jgi:hypothetical protein
MDLRRAGPVARSGRSSVLSCYTSASPTRLALQQPLGIARREVLTEQQHACAWEAVVRIERRDGSSGWRSTCTVCTTQLVYYWSPDQIDERGSAVRREGNCLYQ